MQSLRVLLQEPLGWKIDGHRDEDYITSVVLLLTELNFSKRSMNHFFTRCKYRSERPVYGLVEIAIRKNKT